MWGWSPSEIDELTLEDLAMYAQWAREKREHAIGTA